jgi:hypothetical protein
MEAVKEYNYGFDSNVRRFEGEQTARDRLQTAIGEALGAGPFAHHE